MELLEMVRKGDREGLRAAAGAVEGLKPEEKLALTRAAARSGQEGILRDLFERLRLFAADEDAGGRTLLHEAAASGERGVTEFCMDVLGFDPLSGDEAGVTPLDEARRADKRDAYETLRARLGFGAEDCYRNPVLRGFHPDPSVVRVGEDFYLVNSSFMFFPGLPVFHSRDLVRWELIGHAAENLDWSGLAGLGGGFGYWAPDISYFKGKFWVTATLRRDSSPTHTQMLTWAEDPRGPWSKPVFLPLAGIDPSLFTDDDGRRYMLLNPGATLTEIGEGGEILSEPQMIFYGDARIKPEGPHLLKKDGWYYLFLAEGGTGEGHMETVMRSRALRGPYVRCPYNPILSRKRDHSPIQRSGHGKPVMLPDGRWYMIYLCGRKAEGRTVMGRETALDPIEWTPDGWPLVNGLKGPSCLQRKPFPDRPSEILRNAEWVAPRSDPRDFAVIGEGEIRLTGGRDPATVEPCSVLLRRQSEAAFRQEAEADVSRMAEGGFGGLCGYYDEHSFFLFGLRRTASGAEAQLITQIGDERRTETLACLDAPICRLRIVAEGLSRQAWLDHGSGWILLRAFRAEYLSDEGLNRPKRFTGALLGLAAVGVGETRAVGYREEMGE